MALESAGVLLVRRTEAGVEFLLAHPGGPLFAKRDHGAWTIPKGLIEPGEAPLAAAVRECREETGLELAPESLLPLGQVRLKSGKRVHAWCALLDCDPESLCSNQFELEWPPKSGKRQQFPELDRFGWFSQAQAELKLNPAQVPFLFRAVTELNSVLVPRSEA